MTDGGEDLKELLQHSTLSGSLRSAVFSGPRQPKPEIRRIDIRPVRIRGSVMWQFSSQSATQVFHQNHDSPAAAIQMVRLLEDFRNLRIACDSETVEARLTKNGQWLMQKKRTADSRPTPQVTDHNRTRPYLIPEGVPCPFLHRTGVMTDDGRVRASHSRKFRQINRFLEFIHDIVEFLPSDRTLHVVDFGCGKSYLTFATHYLLTVLLKRSVRIIGLDRRSDVVQTCSEIADELSLQDLRFCVGDISTWDPTDPVDLVISLHACDTATDDALLQAVRWKSRVILAVPCCQHEFNSLLGDKAFPPISTYGLVKERFASLATDSARAALLTAAGYPTQILEFIDLEHTPKNLLLRSVLRENTQGSPAADSALQDVRRLRTMLRIEPLTLERGLIRLGLIPPDSVPADAAVDVNSSITA